MSNLTVKEIRTSADLLAYIKDEANSQGNLSIRGVAKLSGVDHKAVIDGGDFASLKIAQKLTEQGFEAGDLTANGFPPQAVMLTLEYFAYESKVQSEQARNLLMTFGTIGFMETLKQLSEPVIDGKQINSLIEMLHTQQSQINVISESFVRRIDTLEVNLIRAETKLEVVNEFSNFKILVDAIAEDSVRAEIKSRIDAHYSDTFTLLTLKEVIEFFLEGYADESQFEEIYKSVRHGINTWFIRLTGNSLLKKKGRLACNKHQVVFVLWHIVNVCRDFSIPISLTYNKNEKLERLMDL